MSDGAYLADSVASRVAGRLQADVRDSAAAIAEALVHLPEIDRWAAIIVQAFAAGGKVLVLGNGGSAAQAQHLASELVGHFEEDRPPLPAIALATDGSVLTSLANDLGVAAMFARQVAALATAADVVVAISTSGRSPNVAAAIQAAQAAGAAVLCLLGKAAPAPAGVQGCISLASPSTARVQEAHTLMCHLLCTAIELRLGAATQPPSTAADPVADASAASPAASPAAGPAVGSKLVDLAQAAATLAAWRDAGLSIATTNGCFDVLHAGHVSALAFAKAQADRLVVALNTDESVRGLKGPGRPHVPFEQRAEVLGALAAVDLIVAMPEADPRVVLEHLRPDVHCKGADYAGRPMLETEVVQRYGGRIVLAPLVPGLSTTALLTRALPDPQ